MATEDNGYSGDRRPDNGNGGTPPPNSDNLGEVTRGQGTDRLSGKNWEDIDAAVARSEQAPPDPGDTGSLGVQADDYIAHILDGDDGKKTLQDITTPIPGQSDTSYDTTTPTPGQSDTSYDNDEVTSERVQEGDTPLDPDSPATENVAGAIGSGDSSFFDGLDTGDRISEDEKKAVDDAFADMDRDTDRDVDVDDTQLDNDKDNPLDQEAIGNPDDSGTRGIDSPLDSDVSPTSGTKNQSPNNKGTDTVPSPEKEMGQSTPEQDRDSPASQSPDQKASNTDRPGEEPTTPKDTPRTDTETPENPQQGDEGASTDGKKPTIKDANAAPTDSRLGGTDGGRGLEATNPDTPEKNPFDGVGDRPGNGNPPGKKGSKPGLNSLMPLAGGAAALSPFGNKIGGAPQTASSVSQPSPFESEPGKEVDKSPSPFDDAKVAEGFGDGGAGVNPGANVPARNSANGLAPSKPGNGGGGGGGGGKPPIGGPPPALPSPQGDDDGGGMFSPAKMLKNPIFIAVIIIVSLILGLLLVVNGNNMSTQQNAGPMVCDMDSQKESFKSGTRGVPDGEYAKPARMPTGVFTSGYGARWGTTHEGDDIADADNSELFAYSDGVVTHSGSASGYGHWVIINHFGGEDGDFDTLYGHMYADDLMVNVGDEVKAGQVIALMGSDGGSTGTHLHFEVHPGGYRNAIDPREWVEKGMNPGETSSRQDIDGLDEEEEEEANASSGQRTFNALETVSAPETARAVQGGPGISKNSNRTLLIAGKEYAAPKGSEEERQLDATMTYTMEGSEVKYVDSWYSEENYSSSPAAHSGHDYYHGRWAGITFIPAKEDIRHADHPDKLGISDQGSKGGLYEVVKKLEENDKSNLKNYGRIVISANDLKRYKPALMPHEPDPGTKHVGWIPHNDRNWVDKGWFVEQPPTPAGPVPPIWVDNPWYVPEASASDIDGQHPGWRDVGRNEIRRIIDLANDNGVEVYFATGAGTYGVENNADGANNADYIGWAVSEGLIDQDQVVDWAEFANSGEYSAERGGLTYQGAQKFADSVRVVAWGENRNKLPTGGDKGFEYGKDSKLPSNEYDSPYRDTKYKGNRKMTGYEGGYKIANGSKLTHDSMTIAQAIQEQFPEVQTIGGWRPSDPYPDHPSGRAVDVMIPDYKTTRGKNLGSEINDYILDNADFFNVEYSIWAQTYHPANGASNRMEDRGSDTQNHFDHVHITVNQPGDQNKGSASGAKADESYYYGPFPERDGSPMRASGLSGFSTCCPTNNPNGSNDSGNFVSGGNVIGLDDTILRNSAIIIEGGRELGKSDNEIIIALMTAAGETGGGFQNYANDGANWAQSGSANVPPEVLRQSLNYHHDAVAHDTASVGVFQQQVGYWGTVEDLMLHAYQTGQFYAEMENKNAGDETFGAADFGLAAATIQVNQPGRAAYDAHEGLAKDLLESYDGDRELSNGDKADLNRGYENRKNDTSSDGLSGVSDGTQADSPTNNKDRALNGGCGVSSSLRRNNQVKYDEDSAEAIVEAARGEIGTDYAWGGGSADGPTEPTEGPDVGVTGYDASGLTLYAAAQAGITLPRSAAGQMDEGKTVGDIADAKPGDLIFWSDHVGIYSGDGKVIHALESGEKVEEVPVWDTAEQPITGIKRIATDQ